MFGPILKHGPLLDDPVSYEITLHDKLVRYSMPGGALGIKNSRSMNFNYKSLLKKFEARHDGRVSLDLHGASWEYFRRGILSGIFPDGAGTLGYELTLVKLPDDISDIQQYIWNFIDNVLDGPDGINTGIRERQNGGGEAWWVKRPDTIKVLKNKVSWQCFRLDGYPQGKATEYYFHLLAPGYALCIEACAHSQENRKKEYAYMVQTSDAAVGMILDSLTIG